MISHSFLMFVISAFKKVLHTTCVTGSNKNWQSLTLSFRGLAGWMNPALSFIKKERQDHLALVASKETVACHEDKSSVHCKHLINVKKTRIITGRRRWFGQMGRTSRAKNGIGINRQKTIQNSFCW